MTGAYGGVEQALHLGKIADRHIVRTKSVVIWVPRRVRMMGEDVEVGPVRQVGLSFFDMQSISRVNSSGGTLRLVFRSPAKASKGASPPATTTLSRWTEWTPAANALTIAGTTTARRGGC